MPENREELYSALLKADAAGDTASAKVLADYIRSLPADESAPDPAAETAPDVGIPETVYRGAVQGGTFRFGDEIKAGFGASYYAAAKGVRSLLPGGVPEDAPDIVTVYRAIRDQEQQANAAAQQANPGTYLASEIGGGLAVTGTNPVSAVRSVGGAVFGGGRALLSGTPGAARSLLSLESAAGAVAGAKAAGTGAGYAALASAGGSEADLTKGEFGEFASGVADDALKGAGVGFLTRGLLGARSAGLPQRTAAAAEAASLADDVTKFDEATAALPESRVATAGANTAARAEAKAATQAKQAEAQAAAEAKTLENPLKRTRLEGKQKALGGGPRAKAKAEALLNEPDPVNPGKKLFESAEKLSVDEQVDLAERLRRQTGAELGKIRDELAATGATVPAAEARTRMAKAFEDLSSDIRGTAIKRLDAMIAKASKDGAVPADALRVMIRDVEQFAKTRTPKLEAAFGSARGKVFTAAGDVLKGLEGEALAANRPELVPTYTEALRKYGVYSDFETSARVAFDRFYRGQPVVRIPKAGKVEPVAPALQPEPQAPQFPGGEERLAKGRALLEPSRAARAGALGIRAGLPTAGAAIGGAIGGGAGAAIGAAAGGAAQNVVTQRWLRWMTPTPGRLSARVQKLERLRPMMEEALSKGPAEVARLHALLMARSPDYRKAIESDE